ncbi:hypothetical protein MASR2M78_07810 [Treponema sp.]
MRFPRIQKPLSGIVIPIGALRTSESIGVGEFLDLIEFANLSAKIGFSVIQLLPVNDSGFQSSPYSALTAFGLNPLYLRLSALPTAKGFSKQIKAIHASFEKFSRFSYEAILRAKLALLSEMYEKASTQIGLDAESGALAAWIKANEWVIEYAVFRRLKEKNKGSHWKEWAEYSEPTAKDIQSLWQDPKLRTEHLFWIWIQYELDSQFVSASKAVSEAGLALKGDLPILMNEDSCDVWAHPEFFKRDLAAGAPPDMFSPLGQNWQFPIYDWEALARDDYSWWRKRLLLADRYYAAYRIDHVLGFFRIWAASRRDTSAVLGRFIPSVAIEKEELQKMGFEDNRLRWLSQPHIPTEKIYEALVHDGIGEKNTVESASAAVAEATRVFEGALDRIGSEELWLFKSSIRGELDINALSLHPAATAYLHAAWRDRTLLEFEEGRYIPTWTYWDSHAFPTLSEDERSALESLIEKKRQESEAIWEVQGRRLLSALVASTPMLACAEDLGAVPDCVPRVLEELGVLGLRVLRWSRLWGEGGEPYIPLDRYPPLSVATAAVHDSSTVREWWEKEADRDVLRSFLGNQDLSDTYKPETAAVLLGSLAKAASKLCVYQIQDLLHLSSQWYAKDPQTERVNVPGTVNDFNWTYRLPATIAEIASDTTFIDAAKALSDSRKSSPNIKRN